MSVALKNVALATLAGLGAFGLTAAALRRRPRPNPLPKETVWYHGGPRIDDWSAVRWDRDRSQSDLNAEGPGVYWTTDLDEASGYSRGGTVYVATTRDGFRLLSPKKKPMMPALRAFYALASPERQEIFLSNWSIEMPASQRQIDAALHPYTGQLSLFDAYVTLYHDLFGYDAEAYVEAMRTLGYDGIILKVGTTGGYRRRKHLLLWNLAKMRIAEYEGGYGDES